MQKISQSVLWLGGVILLLYPLWGFFFPTSFEVELSEHYAYAEGVSAAQVRASAAMLWLSNGIIALAFFSLARCISHPTTVLYAKFAGIGLILYPFFRTFVEVWSGFNLTSHAVGVEVSLEFSSEKLLFIVLGLAFLGASSAWSELNKKMQRTS